MAALPSDHPIARKRGVRLGDLDDEMVLLLEEGHCMRSQTLALCPRRRRGRASTFHATSIESLRQMVSAGLGCTILPAFATLGPFNAESNVAIRPFVKPAPTRPLVLAWRRSCPHSLAHAQLASLIGKRLHQTLQQIKARPN